MFQSILILFLLILVGYIVGKRNIVNTDHVGSLSTLLMRVTLPMTLLDTMLEPFEEGMIAIAAKTFLTILVVLLVYGLINYAVVSKTSIPLKKQGTWMFGMTFSNNGFIGIPFMGALFGPQGIFLMSMGNVAQNALVFSLGIKMVKRGYYEGKSKFNPRETLFNNVNIAIILGIILNLAQVNVPMQLREVIAYLGAMTTPLSMLVVGISMAKQNFKEMFTTIDPFIISFMRLLVIPMITIVIMKLTGFGAGTLLPYVAIYTTALPPPALLSILSERYEGNIKLAGQCVFLGTLFSMLTLPIVSFVAMNLL